MINIIKKKETHPLTWMIKKDKKPIYINEYKNKNGYVGATKAIKTLSPKEIISIIIQSKLKGRGGAGFLTGIKWNLMNNNINKNKNRYLICNADEMEPGTYKDKLLMEQIPHLLIEGMLIASYALNISIGYIFIRNEYNNAQKILQYAIKEAQNQNLLGNNILNSNFNLQIIIHSGAGRYICGEETALINSLEGKRPIPRSKPPFPATCGLWGKPTCINNVETLCNLPGILENGVSWYKNISIKYSTDTGTKLMGFSGNVNNPNIWELPFGISAKELLEDYAQGMKKGFKLKTWLPGGASTSFITANKLNTPMDFNNIFKTGSRLGTALATAIDDKINIVSLVYNIVKFFSRESCGWCTPCRDGLPWIVNILYKLKTNNGNYKDIKYLKNLCKLLNPGNSFCAHASGAINPLKSALKYFKTEFYKKI